MLGVRLVVGMAQVARNFGGCRRLVADYRAIGISLLRYEHACAALLVGTNSMRALNELRVDVASISTETLESYLDDVVNPSLPLEELYLVRGKINLLSGRGITLVALAVAGLVGIVTAAADFPLATSTAAAPFILVAVLFALSRNRTIRRLRFAHALRIVIASRKGDGIRRIKPELVLNQQVGSAAA